MQLTVRQTRMINKATALLPVADQAAFAKSIHNVIGHWVHEVSDAEVRDLLRVLLSKHGISVGELLTPSRRHFVHQRVAQNWRNWDRKHTEAST
jgi:hypothetical protein